MVKTLQRVPLIAQMAGLMIAIFLMPPKDVGSFDLDAQPNGLVY